MAFPAVTLCNFNMFQQSLLLNDQDRLAAENLGELSAHLRSLKQKPGNNSNEIVNLFKEYFKTEQSLISSKSFSHCLILL